MYDCQRREHCLLACRHYVRIKISLFSTMYVVEDCSYTYRLYLQSVLDKMLGKPSDNQS